MEQGIKIKPKELRVKVREAIQDFKELTGVSLSLEAIRPKGDVVGDSGARLQKYNGVSNRVREIYEQRIAKLVGKVFERSK